MEIKTETKVGLFILVAISIFVYMGFSIGAFRFDRTGYSKYYVNFTNVSGLSRKAEVKIAGVDVGWLEDFELTEIDNMAKVTLMIKKGYVLHKDAYATIKQDGLLGTKYIEVCPGDPLLPKLDRGATLTRPSVSQVSFDDALQNFKKIVDNVEEVTGTLREAMAGPDGKAQLKETFNSMNEASRRLASFAETMDRTVSRNEESISEMVGDFKEFAREAREKLIPIGKDVNRVADKLDSEVLPAFQDSMNTVASVFDRDFDRVATKLEKTAGSFEGAAVEARDGFKNIGNVAGKIDDGKGVLGGLVNDDQTYKDLKFAISGLKNYFAKIDDMSLIIDSHFESMSRVTKDYNEKDSKGYFELKIYPNDDHFYMIQLVTSEKGFIDRKEKRLKWEDNCGDEIYYDKEKFDKYRDTIRFAPITKKATRHRDSLRVGAQMGKIFGSWGFRAGLIDNTFGVGVDYDIPFPSEKLRWITSLEAYDFRGRNLWDERITHLKWLNKIYFLRNVYFAFGADNFISKKDASGYWGAGIRFEDDDLKYILSKVGFTGMGSSN
ncbi:MAG: Mammalian cell entry related domain protein [candidate division TM6 bacterium GW2011_GWF2_32_72]|nr:MAG: Mammalian cell entry related domain protein [candidate division TM6 bacterium GW2011_GWF2_32_72]